LNPRAEAIRICCFTDANGTAEHGTILVGATSFRRHRDSRRRFINF
jgi:hypothetical protein